MVAQEVGALGHGDKKPFFIPKKVSFFDEIDSKVIQIAAGMYHNAALTEDGTLYTWGRGAFGVLGNGDNSYSLIPRINEDVEILKEEGLKPLKIEAADDYTSILMDNGEVFGFGKNDRGQLGVNSGIGIDFQESLSVPTELEFDGDEGMPMVDISCGQNTTLFKDTDGDIWKTGLKLDYTPKKIDLTNDIGVNTNIGVIGCGTKHYCLVNKENQMLVWGNMFSNKSNIDINGFKLYEGDTLFNEGKVRDMSIKYSLFGVVTEHD